MSKYRVHTADQVSLPLLPQEEVDTNESEETQSLTLFVGSLAAAQSLEFLERNEITHVLSVVSGMNVVLPKSGIHHKTVAIHDHPMANLLEVLPECLGFVAPAAQSTSTSTSSSERTPKQADSPRRVLVHCASGISRSVAVCAALLMTRYHLNAHQAIRTIASVRKYANPNLGFRQQLKILEESKTTNQHDIAAANERWLRLHAGDVVLETQRQREMISSLHALVDAVETSIATKLSKKQHASLRVEKNRLLQLQAQLDASLPTEEGGIVDPPSRMMRKSANAKINRLMESLSFSAEDVPKDNK